MPLGATRAPSLYPTVNASITRTAFGDPAAAATMGGSPWAEGWEGSYEGRESLLYGMGRSALLVAGAEATFRRCEPLLRSLAGGLSYVGDQVGAGMTVRRLH